MTGIADPYRATPYVLNRDTAPAFWLVATLWLSLATGAQTANRFALLEQLMPPGLGPPTHRHPDADEGFYILDGTCAFHADGETHYAGPGTFLHLPRRTPHSFSVESDGARALNFYAPAGFELIVMSCARPADERRRPTMAESAPPAADQVQILSRLFGQEAVLALPFAAPPDERLMVTTPLGARPGDWSPSAPHMATAANAPAFRAFGLTWRLLAASADTAGTYDLFEVTVPAGGGLEPRLVGQDEALYVLEGTVHLTLEGAEQAVAVGSFSYVPAGAACAWRAGAEGARLLVFHLPGGFDAAITRYGGAVAASGASPSGADTAGDDDHVRAYLRAAGTRFGIGRAAKGR